MEPVTTIRLNLTELKEIANRLKDETELRKFFDEQIKKAEDFKQEQIDKHIQEVTPNFCEPGVNCE